MIVAIIIIAYVLSVFLNRWLDKIFCSDSYTQPTVLLWFIPVLPAIALLFIIVADNLTVKKNWFTGKYWK
jgi:predicted PurR-regulated permease PerM